MRSPLLAIDESLRQTSRLPSLSSTAGLRGAEVLALLLSGAVASLLTNLVRLRLGIPGSAIVYAAVPLALGFALVPRRGAGVVMAGGAILTTLILRSASVRLDGIGALTSLVATGPLLDVGLRWGRTGRRLYGAFVLACAASNALAFTVRASARLMGIRGGGGGGGGAGFGGGGGRAFAQWLPQAMWTYALAGVAAGLVSAIAWFHFRERHRGSTSRRAN